MEIKILGLIDCDFVNYKEPSLTLMFPYCSFKCNKEAGKDICHNSKLCEEPKIDISLDYVVQLYKENPITKAIVIQGLEPLDSYVQLIELIDRIRKEISDPIIIYTGYTEDEVANGAYFTHEIKFSKERVKLWNQLKSYNNIIIKFGRYIEKSKPHYDEILGVNLASYNQYAKYIN